MDKSLQDLIRMSIENGAISDEKMATIKAKAKEVGIESGELQIYVDHLIKESEASFSKTIDNLSKKSKTIANEGFKAIQSGVGKVSNDAENPSSSVGKIVGWAKAKPKQAGGVLAISLLVLYFLFGGDSIESAGKKAAKLACECVEYSMDGKEKKAEKCLNELEELREKYEEKYTTKELGEIEEIADEWAEKICDISF